ncbi:hypothetical protein ACS0TY_001614 [Phlomoides rotata]
MCLHVGGTFDDKGYVGRNIHKFDYINVKVYTLSALEKFARNVEFGGNSILYSCDKDGQYVPLFNDVNLRSIIKRSILGSKEVDIYIVNVESEDDTEDLESDSADSDHREDEDTESESDGEVSGLVSEGGSIEGESGQGVDVRAEDGQRVDEDSEGSGEEDVNQSDDDFNSVKGSDSEGEVDRCLTFNPKHLYDPHLKLKMIFSNKWEFIEAVHSTSVLKKRDIKLVKNDSGRVHARCSGEDCPWRVHVNNVHGEPSF